MGFVLLLALGFAVFWVFLVLLTLHALLRPSRRTYAWCVARTLPADPGSLTPPREFEQGSITEPTKPHAACPVWNIAGDDPDGPVVIYCHGWGESRQSILQRLPALTPACSRVIAWDMPGHGETSPGCARMGTTEHRALTALIDEQPADTRIVLLGFSFGGGICLRAALERPDRVAAVIAEAPYRLPWTPARNVMHLAGFPHRLNLRPALWLAGLLLDRNPFWRGFDRADLAAKLACPLLVLHALDDEMCPAADGQAIAAAAPQASYVEIPDATHTTLWLSDPSRDLATDAALSFLKALPRTRPAASPPGQ